MFLDGYVGHIFLCISDYRTKYVLLGLHLPMVWSTLGIVHFMCYMPEEPAEKDGRNHDYVETGTNR